MLRSIALAVGLLLLAGLVVVLATAPGRAGLKTVLLIPEILPGAPFRPLPAFTGEPLQEAVQYPYSGGRAQGTLFRPAGNQRYGAVILFLGINPDMENQTLLRLATALAREDIVVLLPWPVQLTQGRISYEEVEAIVGAFRFLQNQPYVNPQRIGLVGFSVGSSLALIAAADPSISQDLRFVNAFGGYYSAESLFWAMTTRQIELDGSTEPWEPTHDALVWFSQQLINSIEDAETRSSLERAFVSGEPLAPAEVEALSLPGRMVYEALTNRDPQRAGELFQALPEALMSELARLSPSTTLKGLKTAVYIMHDRNDTYIPYTESRRLAAALAGYPHLHYTEFALFQHVEPTKSLELWSFLREIAKLYGHLSLLMLELS